MASVEIVQPENRDSTALPSKNPFRKEDDVESSLTPRHDQRPLSRNNPFLDSPNSPGEGQASPNAGEAKQLFRKLVTEPQRLPPLNQRPPPPGWNGPRPPPGTRPPPGMMRGRGGPPRGRGGLPIRPREKDVFADPSRPRSNSESSALIKPVDGERKSPEKREKHRSSRKGESSRSKRDKVEKLDTIDKLDVTGIYGPTLFHHDGPFDACNPHRNRNSRRAPMQAFPEGSANNAIGGAVPTTLDQNKIFGNRDPEAFSDFSAGTARPPVEDFKYTSSRGASILGGPQIDPVHGEETLGLGTSTFLEGAPASRTAMQRRASEQDGSGGLSRKKSLAQRIKSVRRPEGGPSREPVHAPPEEVEYEEYDHKGDGKATEVGKTAEVGEQETSPRVARLPLERRVTDGDKPSGFLNRVKSLKQRKPPSDDRAE